MQTAIMIDASGKATKVNASLQPLGSDDTKLPTLHIRPALFLPKELLDAAELNAVSLAVESSFELNLPSIVHVRRPYPNYCYLVGGTELERNGWLVPIQGDVPDSIELKFTWSIPLRQGASEAQVDSWTLEHYIGLHLRQGGGNVYSMDPSNWPYDADSAPPLYTAPVGFVGEEGGDNPSLADRQASYTVSGTKAVIREIVTVPGVPLSQAHTVGAFQSLQLHEFAHTSMSGASASDKAHLANGELEVPARLFRQAVLDARARDWRRMVYRLPQGGLEQHPALSGVCRWWNERRSSAAVLKAGSFMPMVRVADDGQYWCADRQVPNEPVDGFSEPHNAARVGASVLLEFRAKQTEVRWNSAGLVTLKPDGSELMTECISEEDYSPLFQSAYECLEALAQFPQNFPAAWEEIVAAVS